MAAGTFTQIVGGGGTKSAMLDIPASTQAVLSGAAQRISIGPFTIPCAFSRIDMVAIQGLQISAPTNTNQLELGVGTAEATGSGTSLTGTLDDIVAGVTSPALTSSGITVSSTKAMAAVGTVYDGPTTLYLNMAPKTNWTASEDITVAGGKVSLTYSIV